MINWFKKKVQLSDDYVELSIGTTYYKPLFNYNIRNAENQSQGNWKLYYTLIEIELLNLDQSQYETLTVEDGQKIRFKTIEILKRYQIEEPVKNDFSPSDIKFFQEKEKDFNDKVEKSITQVNP